MRRRQALGMSLPELLVSLALASIILLAGTSLLLQLTRQASVEMGREQAVGSQIDVALKLIARDLRQARRLPLPEGEGDGDLLRLLLPGERRVIYRRTADQLLRAVSQGEDVSFRERVLLTEVLTVDFSLRPQDGVWDIWLRQLNGDIKHTAVLPRNLNRDLTGELR